MITLYASGLGTLGAKGETLLFTDLGGFTLLDIRVRRGILTLPLAEAIPLSSGDNGGVDAINTPRRSNGKYQCLC